MGKRGHAIGMVLCILLAIISQFYSEEINSLFEIDVSGPESIAAPLVGLQNNESWLVVLVDFESNPLTESAKDNAVNELNQYTEDYLSQAIGSPIDLSIVVHS